MALKTGFQGYYKARAAIVGNNLVVGNSGISGVAYVTPAGSTTSDYLLNGSTGVFNLPVGSNVIFAELVLGGAGFNATGTFEFMTPVTTVSLPYGTLETGGWSSYYQDVTNLIKNGGSGTYRVSKVNGSMSSTMWFLI